MYKKKLFLALALSFQWWVTLGYGNDWITGGIYLQKEDTQAHFFNYQNGEQTIAKLPLSRYFRDGFPPHFFQIPSCYLSFNRQFAYCRNSNSHIKEIDLTTGVSRESDLKTVGESGYHSARSPNGRYIICKPSFGPFSPASAKQLALWEFQSRTSLEPADFLSNCPIEDKRKGNLAFTQTISNYVDVTSIYFRVESISWLSDSSGAYFVEAHSTQQGQQIESRKQLKFYSVANRSIASVGEVSTEEWFAGIQMPAIIAVSPTQVIMNHGKHRGFWLPYLNYFWSLEWSMKKFETSRNESNELKGANRILLGIKAKSQ